MSNQCEWDNCFIKNAHKISRILPYFIICKRQIFSLFLILSRRVQLPYCSYTMMAKPIRAPELLYPMIQFLIISNQRNNKDQTERNCCSNFSRPASGFIRLEQLFCWVMLADFSTGLFSWVFAASTTPTFKYCYTFNTPSYNRGQIPLLICIK